MSRLNRHKRRALSFENLEAKTSPTSLGGLSGFVDSAEKIEATTANQFLQYVSTMKEISIERGVADETDANAVDLWIAATLPPT